MAADDAAVVVSLRANLKDYEAALKQAVRITERAATAAEASLSGVGKRANFGAGMQQGAAQASRSMGAMQADAKNLGFQINDLATSIASGGGAMRAFAQQGGQISQIFSGMGLRSMGALLTSALLDPFVMIPVAIGIATVAFSNFFSSAESDAENQRKLLDQIRQKWGDLIPGVKEYIDSIDDATEHVERHAAKVALVDQAWTDVKPAIADVSKDVQKMLQQMRLSDQAEDAARIAKLFQDWRDEIGKGRPGFEQLQKLLEQIQAVSKNGSSAAAQLAQTINDKLAPALEGVKQKLQDIDKLFGGFQMPGAGGPLDLSPLTGQNRVDLLNKAISGAAGAIDAFVERIVGAESGGRANARNPNSTATGVGQFLESTWLDVINKYFPAEAVGKTRQQILDLRQDSELSRRAIRRYAEENARALQDSGETISEANLHLAHFLGAGGALQVLKAAPGTRISDIPGMGAAVRANPTVLGGGATREDVLAYAERRARSAGAQKEANTQLEDWLKLSQQDLDLKNRQLDLDAQFWDSEARRKAQMEEQKLIQEGLNAAMEQYGTVTDENRAKIEAAAHAQAFASVKSEEAAGRQKQLADRQQENAKAAADFAQQISQMAQSAIGGLINDLRNGVDAGDAFNNMLQRILDSLIQMSLQTLFSPSGGGGLLAKLFGIGGGAFPAAPGGGLFHGGGTVGMSGQHDGRRFPAAMWAGAPRFASGGVVGLRPGEVPIIAHRGEIVVPNVGRIGAGRAGAGNTSINNQLGPVSIDMSSTGMVAAGTDQARQFGENVRRIIQVEMMRESRPGGLLRQQPGAG